MLSAPKLFLFLFQEHIFALSLSLERARALAHTHTHADSIAQCTRSSHGAATFIYTLQPLFMDTLSQQHFIVTVTLTVVNYWQNSEWNSSYSYLCISLSKLVCVLLLRHYQIPQTGDNGVRLQYLGRRRRWKLGRHRCVATDVTKVVWNERIVLLADDPFNY